MAPFLTRRLKQCVATGVVLLALSLLTACGGATVTVAKGGTPPPNTPSPGTPSAGTTSGATPALPSALTFVADKTDVQSGEKVTFTATANRPVDGTGYHIEIDNSDLSTVKASCSTGTECSIALTNSGVTNTYEAFVKNSSSTPLLYSKTITVKWDVPPPNIAGNYYGKYFTDQDSTTKDILLTLQQSGNQLTGTTTEPGGTANDTGTVDGSGNLVINETFAGNQTAQLKGKVLARNYLSGTWTASNGHTGTWQVSPAAQR